MPCIGNSGVGRGAIGGDVIVAPVLPIPEGGPVGLGGKFTFT